MGSLHPSQSLPFVNMRCNPTPRQIPIKQEVRTHQSVQPPDALRRVWYPQDTRLSTNATIVSIASKRKVRAVVHTVGTVVENEKKVAADVSALTIDLTELRYVLSLYVKFE